jgi:hypothetical protein
MKGSKLNGKRYINLVRCSTHGQADTSIDDQLNVNKAFATQHGMVHVDDVVLEGVTGSIPGARRDIGQILERKATRDDFEILLVQDPSRLTRGGALHGASIEYDLRSAGIKVVYVSGDVPEGEFGDVIRGLHYTAAREHAKSISFASTRGAMSAIADGRLSYCRRPPYGVDKLFVGPDGTPHHIIRNLPDGTQVQLHPETREVIQRFGRNERHGGSRHYRKQKDERIVLIPGDDRHVEIVRRIFTRHLIKEHGYQRIAMDLNCEGIPSSTGGTWTVATIRKMLLNPIYVGLGIANRFSSAIYHMRGPDAPIRTDVDDQTLANCRRPPQRTRRRAEWHQTNEDRLDDLLEHDLKHLARAKQDQHLDAQAAGRSPKPIRDRHRQSEYFLKGVLRSKQGDFPMTGRSAGRRKPRTRYYAVGRAYSAPTADRVMQKMVPAEPIEQAVLRLLQVILTFKSDMKDAIRTSVRQQTEEWQTDHSAIANLRAEREATQRKLEFIIDELEEVGRDALKVKTDRLQAKIRSLDERIRNASAGSQRHVGNEAELVDRVTDRLAEIGSSLGDLPPLATRRLIAAFVTRAVVDLETRHVELEIRLPEWALSGQRAMCLDGPFSRESDVEAHQGAVILSPSLSWFADQWAYGAIDFGTAA